MRKYKEPYHKPSLAELKRFAKAWVDHFYEDMQNPKFRGSKFTWKEFPQIVSGLACANLPMSYNSNAKDETKLESIVKSLAEEKVKDQLDI